MKEDLKRPLVILKNSCWIEIWHFGVEGTRFPPVNPPPTHVPLWLTWSVMLCHHTVYIYIPVSNLTQCPAPNTPTHVCICQPGEISVCNFPWVLSSWASWNALLSTPLPPTFHFCSHALCPAHYTTLHPCSMLNTMPCPDMPSHICVRQPGEESAYVAPLCHDGILHSTWSQDFHSGFSIRIRR